MTSKVKSPTRLTAAPSTKVSMSCNTTGRPAEIAAATHGAPSGSTPMMRTSGCVVRSQADAPASSPPPPTGSTTTSGTKPSWPNASTTRVA